MTLRYTPGSLLYKILNEAQRAVVPPIYATLIQEMYAIDSGPGNGPSYIRTTPRTLTQNMTVHQAPSEQWIWGPHIAQVFTIKQPIALQMTYSPVLTQEILMNSVLMRFIGATLTQAMHVHLASADLYQAVVQLMQAMTVHGGLQPPTLLLSLVQNIEMTPTQVLKAIYDGQLTDEVIINALFVSPAGTVTTWAINTRTNAITEYTNYNFNSFAQFGRKYIAAGPTGIYELDGDTDAGVNIIAEVQSGLARLNETKLSGLKGAYLAMRGQGRFYLKIISGDGREYVYEAVTQPGLMTTKVNIGKGLRMSYLAFNLMTEGQDFDLDTLEFVPMLSDRRV